MSDLDQLQKNLNYKIKAQDIGFASWKGQHGKPQKMFIPTKDYLLNNPSKIQDDIKKRNEMMEDYLQEQRTPIILYDEDGDPVEYKFHQIPPPEITYDPIITRIQTLKGLEEITIPPEQFTKFLNELPDIAQNLNRVFLERIDELDQQYTDEKIEFEFFKQNYYKDNKERLEREYNDKKDKIDNDPKILKLQKSFIFRELDNDYKQKLKDLKDRYKDGLERYAEEMSDIKNEISQLNNDIYEADKDIIEVGAKIRNEMKKNEEKVQTYAQELNALNRGELNTAKQFNETDEEYLQRLQQMADVEFPDRRTEERAFLREKDKLRDNLKLIVRDNAVINQVVNSIFSNNPLLLPEINKFFPGFKEYFIKKFGENNDKIRFHDLLPEITFYLKRSTDPSILKGNVLNPEEIAEAIGRNLPTSIIPYQARTASTKAGPFSEESGTSPEQIINEFQQFVKKTDKGIKSLKPPGKEALTGSEYEDIIPEEISEEEEEKEEVFNKLLDNNETLLLYTGNYFNNKSQGNGIYIKMAPSIKTPKDKKYKNAEGVKVRIPDNFQQPNFFYSVKGTKNSFYMSRGLDIVNQISSNLYIPLKDIYDYFGVSHFRYLNKEKLANLFKDLGLKETTEGFHISKTNFQQNGQPIVGWGIKHAQDMPEKVNFGSNILFLKKLFLKNILSIQNKHNTKINGFNNVHVSDNFVKIIMNLLKNINFTHDELNKLSNGERLLLDNLLTLSELNKKFVTGSNTNSLNQLKKDYEILIGEIEAGNNNELLKKKLYSLLMKFVHFGALSQQQARKHYKEIVNDYF